MTTPAYAQRAPKIEAAKLWYTGKPDQKPESIKSLRSKWRGKRNNSPERMDELYPSGLEERKENASESEEEYDENDPDVKQAWQKRRFDIFYDRKVRSAGDDVD